jgi:tellurite resistance protein TerC
MAFWLPWVVFGLGVLALMVLDLGVINRRARLISLREAVVWSGAWVILSLVFCAAVYFWRGPAQALDYFTCYVLEKSLSLDNIFVFAVIFEYAAVPSHLQHKVLSWGVLGALVMRATFIFAGIELVTHFQWVFYILGIFLLVSGTNLLRHSRRDLAPARSRLLRLTQKLVPVTEQYEGPAFFVHRAGRRLVTPLFLALLMIEMADVVFASDSIPAAIAVTQDPLIIYTSNIFAVLGLRALYLLLVRTLERFRYLHTGLSLVLVFVGAKMLLVRWVRIPTHWALLTILAILAIAALASLHAEKRVQKLPPNGTPGDGSAA